MSTGGDFEAQPIDIRNISYSPSFESGEFWATQYSSELNGALALSQSAYMLSNFVTRDIGGRTGGICVNPWDFNFVKAKRIDGTLAKRPENYNRTSFRSCDCSYYKCDRDFQGLGFTLDFNLLWNGEGSVRGLIEAFRSLGQSDDPSLTDGYLLSLGFPFRGGNILSNYGGAEAVQATITPETLDLYKTEIAKTDTISQGSKETNLLTYALINFCGSVTAGIAFKNNIISFLAFAQDTLQVTGQDWGSSWEDGGGDWNGVAKDIVDNYQRNANIPGFSAELLYSQVPGLEGIQEKCMCLDGGLYGYDAHPFADWNTVNDQLTVEGEDAGGIDKYLTLGFEGNTLDLAKYLTIDGKRLKTLGVSGAKDYLYGPNWFQTWAFSDLNVINVTTPAYKNWECRNSSKIRMAGSPNGEPYSFGNQWLEWGQRIGVPPIQYIPVSPITLGGGDFVDPNFGYKGSVEGSLIYKGKLTEDYSVYETQDYEFAFLGITNGNIGTGNKKYFFGLTSIPHLDAVTNLEAYGVSGSIEDIVFTKTFSESPQDKTIYRL